MKYYCSGIEIRHRNTLGPSTSTLYQVGNIAKWSQLLAVCFSILYYNLLPIIKYFPKEWVNKFTNDILLKIPNNETTSILNSTSSKDWNMVCFLWCTFTCYFIAHHIRSSHNTTTYSTLILDNNYPSMITVGWVSLEFITLFPWVIKHMLRDGRSYTITWHRIKII